MSRARPALAANDDHPSSRPPEHPSGRATDWEARFRAGTTGWERGTLHPSFLAWREEGRLAPCRVLVPGAGRSPEPLAMARAGFDVTVLDLAASAIAAQRAAFAAAGATARIVHADLFAFHPDRPFDAVWDQTCLCALPPASLPGYAARLLDWVRPDGTLFALLAQTGQADGPPFDCPVPLMRGLLGAPAWGWPVPLPAPVPHPAGFMEQPVALVRIA